MNASEARRITEKNMPTFKEVYDIIRRAASDADSSVRFDLEGKNKKFVKELITDLEGNGYSVKRETGSDQRDNEEWDYLVILW